LLDALAKASVDKVFDVLESLDAAAARLDPASHRALGQLQLDMVRASGVTVESLNSKTQEKFLRAMGSANEMALQQLDAAGFYEQLLVKRPRDFELMEKVARLRMTGGAASDWTTAKQHWLTLEAQQKAGSLKWLECRLESLVCMHRLHENAACQKRLRLTALLYPNLGNPAVKKRFTELEKLAARETARR
jgi:hypothetical protein